MAGVMEAVAGAAAGSRGFRAIRNSTWRQWRSARPGTGRPGRSRPRACAYGAIRHAIPIHAAQPGHRPSGHQALEAWHSSLGRWTGNFAQYLSKGPVCASKISPVPPDGRSQRSSPTEPLATEQDGEDWENHLQSGRGSGARQPGQTPMAFSPACKGQVVVKANSRPHSFGNPQYLSRSKIVPPM